MKRTYLAKRLFLFVLGLLLSGFGVALSVKANLGTSPLASVPYVLSKVFPLTIGQFMILLNVVFILAQILLLRKKFKLISLLQIVACILFGGFTDLATMILIDIVPQSYLLQWLLCLISIFITAIGVYMVVKADIMILASEGLANAISEVSKADFGKAKIAIDVSFTILAVVMSFSMLHNVQGVREGSVAAALLVGIVIRTINKRCKFIDVFLGNTMEGHLWTITETFSKPHIVITISSEYGPDGVRIAKALSKILKMKLYNEELVAMAAEESGLNYTFVKQHEDQLKNGFLYDLYAQNFEYINNQESDCDKLFKAQRRIIQRLAKMQDCIIVGRNANYILQDCPNSFHVFIHARPEYRATQIQHEFGVDKAKAKIVVSRTDAARRNHGRRYAGKTWGMASAYSLTLDSEKYGIQGSAEIIKDALFRYLYPGGEDSLPQGNDKSPSLVF